MLTTFQYNNTFYKFNMRYFKFTEKILCVCGDPHNYNHHYDNHHNHHHQAEHCEDCGPRLHQQRVPSAG